MTRGSSKIIAVFGFLSARMSGCSSAIRLGLLACVMGLVPLIANGRCSFPEGAEDSGLSPDATAARNQFFEDVCSGSAVDLLLGSDPRVKQQVHFPLNSKEFTQPDRYPELARLMNIQGTVVMAFVLDADGRVRRSRLLLSSGHQVLDQAAVANMSKLRGAEAIEVDGSPVRVFYIAPIVYRLLHGDPEIPPFSDAAANRLGSRILALYNAADAEALYADTDEALRTPFTHVDVKTKWSAYQVRYGSMQRFVFSGFGNVIHRSGTLFYQLRYSLRMSKPAHPMVTMLVTVVPRPERPGIVSFEFTENSPIYTFP
jgi:TonB family protein